MEPITLWRWRRDPSKIVVWNGRLFPGSESFAAEWDAVATFEALNPLTRPIPKGYELYQARRRHAFPYETTAVKKMNNVFFPEGLGLYYIAPTTHEEGLKAFGLPII